MNNHQSYRRVKVFSAAIRAFHWLRASSILVLVITGFYIAKPYLPGANSTDVLLQGWIRFIHLAFGFVLVSVTLSRAYMHFFSKKSDIERRSQMDLFSRKSWKLELRAYFWQGKLDKQGAYEPLQYVTFFTVSLVAAIMSITGLVLYSQVYHHGLGGLLATPSNWLMQLLGGLANVRKLHHYFMWVFIVFVFFHVYLAAWSGIRFKHAAFDAIISGYDYRKRPEKNKNFSNASKMQELATQQIATQKDNDIKEAQQPT